MRDGPNITTVAALIGDQARAQVLTVLMAGQALTATELADAACVTRQTISTHLAQLVEAGLLAVTPQGRHRYFRLAGAEVARMLETLMGVAAGTASPQVRTGPRDPALRRARVCYDHLAGELGVLVYEGLARRGAFALAGSGLVLTPQGESLMAELDVDPGAPTRGRPLCLNCLDWSERRDHLAGALGAALLVRFEQLGWMKRMAGSRALAVGAAQEAALRAWLVS